MRALTLYRSCQRLVAASFAPSATNYVSFVGLWITLTLSVVFLIQQLASNGLLG